MEFSDLEKTVERILQNLVGKCCWGFVAGEGTGSTVSLDFGKKVPLQVPNKNPLLTEDQRKYEGEINLFIESPWTLTSESGIVCSSDDPDDNDGPMVQGLWKIVNKQVRNVKILKPSHDLIINFEGKFTLNIICNQMENEYDNYSVFMGNEIYIVGPKGQISRQERGTKR
jgi:hypothetical protein